MTEIGRLKEFDPSKEQFTTYLKRLKLYFTVNSTADDKKKHIFLLMMGPKVYEILINLAMPKDPEKLTFDEIENALTGYFQPAKLEIVERFQFSKREQRELESINEYAMELKKMAITCNFGAFLQEALRDRLVAGLRNEKIQKEILLKNRSFSEALKVAISLELVEKEAKEMQVQSRECNYTKQNQEKKHYDKRSFISEKKVLRSEPSGNRDKTKEFRECCQCCGNEHLGKCKYTDYSCKKCGKKRHLMKACKMKGKLVRYAQDTDEESNGENEEDDLNYGVSDDQLFYASEKIFKVCNSFTVKVQIDLMDFEMEIDTGASISLVSDAHYNSYLYNKLRNERLLGTRRENCPTRQSRVGQHVE